MARLALAALGRRAAGFTHELKGPPARSSRPCCPFKAPPIVTKTETGAGPAIREEWSMARFVLSFRSVRNRTPDSAEEAAWGDWFQSIGANIVDPGNRVGDARALGNCGTDTALGGYTLVTADDLKAAVALARPAARWRCRGRRDRRRGLSGRRSRHGATPGRLLGVAAPGFGALPATLVVGCRTRRRERASLVVPG